ncbi:MAG: purine-nucleoside phosphorylase [Anaerolineae bacterium]|nr:purine-nucleoside phosphorylase [Anaerolineae bacterium]
MPTPQFSRRDFQRAADVILSKTEHRPKVALILGTGLGSVADSVEDASIIETSELPNWPVSQVHGHKNRLVIGTLEGQSVLVQQGRAHFYEGWEMADVTFNVRVMQMLGIQTLIVTNASGGLNKAMKAGDLMLITDHINFPGMAGNNPLRGPNDDSLGTRFPDVTVAYDPAYGKIAREVAAKEGFTLHEGTYVYLSGPNFESPAEIRMLRLIGGDAVGMSTVPEVLVARHAGIRVLGLSGVANGTNETNTPGTELTHEDVLDAIANKCAPKLIAIVRGVLRSM